VVRIRMAGPVSMTIPTTSRNRLMTMMTAILLENVLDMIWRPSGAPASS
jgi:hypothetical protein